MTQAGSTTTLPADLPVSMEQLAIVDGSRPVVRSGVELAPSRGLPTNVWMPAGFGHWPLVVFVHGYDVGPMTYSRFCSTLAGEGYLVAAPSFPLEDPSRGYGLDRSDLPNEATDVSFVITTLLHGPLAGSIVADDIAVAGHSDGADVALAVGYQQGKVDSRVGAVVAYAPDPMAAPAVPARTPLLLIQGDSDDVVPYSSSQTVFRQVSSPRYYVTLLGAGHLPPIAGGTEWTPVLDQAVGDFLNAEVAHRTDPSSLTAELADSSLVSLRTADLGDG